LLVSRVDHADGSPWGRYAPAAVGQVIRPETARRLREAMMDIVEHGTGKAAALPEHTVAGKTGTAQKSDGRRYVAGRLYCSFVGMVPARDPELVIAVALDEPQGRAYGGTVAAPVFKEIAQQAVLLYNIAPDKQPPSRTRQIAQRQDSTSRRSLFAQLD
jgi:cell division protein FtsI (penicillin-binding protein 3)